jgi:hypothetical protein
MAYNTDGAKGDTSNPFKLNGQTYNVKLDSNVSDGNIKASSITLQKEVTTRSGKSFVAYGESFDGGKTWSEPGSKPPKALSTSSGLTESELKSLQPGGALNKQALSAASQTATKAGATPKQVEQISKGNDSNVKPSNPDTNPEQAATDAQREELSQEAATYADGTRYGKGSYGNAKYPITLQVEEQDCIKFSIVQYVASGLKSAESAAGNRIVSVSSGGIPELGKREILGTVVLPIPGGISDSNGVDWQGDSLDDLSKAFADIAQSAISGGGAAAETATGDQLDKAKGSTGDLKSIFTSKFTQAATGTANIMQRQYGAIVNPNLELLFNSPSLRTFSFTFRLSPREEAEAKEVRKIIRFFKQAMSVKRSSKSYLLKSPHTFAISYITSKNRQHPYLNKFKECALTQCNVNYTPDGNYMTFAGEPSMTSYELSLQFQELVPLYDDEYGNESPDKINSIGF